MKIDADYVFKIGVVALVTVLSLYLVDLSYSYWWDELLSVSQAKLGFQDLFFKTILIDVHPPLYPLLLKGWVALFGDSEISTRFLSFSFAAVALLSFLHNITLLTHNRFERWLSILFFVCAWPFLFYANEVRSYSLLLCFSTLAYFRVYRQQYDLLTYVLLVLLALTHYFGLIFTLFCLLIIFIAQNDWKGRLKAVLCGAVVFIWPVLHVIGGNIAGRTGGAFWIEADPFDVYAKLVELFIPPYVNGTLISAACFLLLIGLAVFTYLNKEKELAIAIVSVWAGLFALALIDLHSPMTTTRNLISLLPVCAHALVVGVLRVFGNKIAVVLVAALGLMMLQTKDRLEQKIHPLQPNKELYQKLEPSHSPLFYYFPTQSVEVEWWLQKLFEVYAKGISLPRFDGCAALQDPVYIVQMYKALVPPYANCEYEVVFSSDENTRLLKASPVAH